MQEIYGGVSVERRDKLVGFLVMQNVTIGAVIDMAVKVVRVMAKNQRMCQNIIVSVGS